MSCSRRLWSCERGIAGGRRQHERDDSKSHLQGPVDQAAHMHLELLDIYNTLFLTSNPIPVKAALNMLGVVIGGLRLPLTEANSAIQAEIRRSLQQLNLIN